MESAAEVRDLACRLVGFTGPPENWKSTASKKQVEDAQLLAKLLAAAGLAAYELNITLPLWPDLS